MLADFHTYACMYMNETKRKLGRNAMPCELKKIFNTSKSIIFRKANKRKAKLPPILGASIYLAHSHNTEHTHTHHHHMDCRSPCPY